MDWQQGVELIVAWLPLVALLVIWVLFMRRANRHYRSHVAEVKETNLESGNARRTARDPQST